MNSRKFAVASNRSDPSPSTPQQHGGTPSASKRSDLVAVVALFCIKELQLVTMQLPEKFSPYRTGDQPNFACLMFSEVGLPLYGVLESRACCVAIHGVATSRVRRFLRRLR